MEGCASKTQDYTSVLDQNWRNLVSRNTTQLLRIRADKSKSSKNIKSRITTQKNPFEKRRK